MNGSAHGHDSAAPSSPVAAAAVPCSGSTTAIRIAAHVGLRRGLITWGAFDNRANRSTRPIERKDQGARMVGAAGIEPGQRDDSRAWKRPQKYPRKFNETRDSFHHRTSFELYRQASAALALGLRMRPRRTR